MSLVFFHPVKSGKGSMASFDLQRAKNGDEGCIWASVAKQNKGRGEKKFDFKNRKIAKLGFPDITQILYGIRKKAKEISLVHAFGDKKTVISWKRVIDDEKHFAGYYFNVGGYSIRFTPPELLGLCKMLDTAIPLIIAWEREERSSVFEDKKEKEEPEEETEEEEEDKETEEDEEDEEWIEE